MSCPLCEAAKAIEAAGARRKESVDIILPGIVSMTLVNLTRSNGLRAFLAVICHDHTRHLLQWMTEAAEASETTLGQILRSLGLPEHIVETVEKWDEPEEEDHGGGQT